MYLKDTYTTSSDTTENKFVLFFETEGFEYLKRWERPLNNVTHFLLEIFHLVEQIFSL